ncbi:MAG: (d)CMP kinase [Planctomycetota bacterium]
MRRLIVTLDGPAGSGKSTIARDLAHRLGLEFLDTGAMYRGLTARCLDRGIDPAEEPHAVVEFARHQPMAFDFDEDPPRLSVGDVDITERLRDQDVNASVSDVAAIGAVRSVMVDAQRQIGDAHPRLVTEGRDQGSVVFPEAEIKFFLEASIAVRAKRRHEQLHDGGRIISLESVRQNLVERDDKDRARKDGPLVCPSDAQTIDTSELTIPQVLDLLEARVREAVPDAVAAPSTP